MIIEKRGEDHFKTSGVKSTDDEAKMEWVEVQSQLKIDLSNEIQITKMSTEVVCSLWLGTLENKQVSVDISEFWHLIWSQLNPRQEIT